MFNLFKRELIIMKRRRKYFIFFIILAITTILTMLLSNVKILSHNSNFDFINYIVNISFGNILVICFTIVLTCEIFGLDESKGTIKTLLVKPVSKYQIVMVKLITIYLYALIQYIFLFIISAILNFLFIKTHISLINILNVFINRNLLGLIFSVILAMCLVIYTKSISISTITPIVLYFIGNELSYSIFSTIRKVFIYSYINVRIQSSYTYVLKLSILYILILVGLSILKFYKKQY